MPAMRSRFRIGLVLVALLAQLLAPLAAYASASALPEFDDFCSASRNARSAITPPGPAPALPRPYSPKHASSHCAFCCGSTSAALLPSALLLPVSVARAEELLPRATSIPVASTSVLLPP